jgi:hypothetical protein
VVASAQVIVIVNHPPFGGNVTVSPLTGRALTTNFTIKCLKWCVEGSALLGGEGPS